MICKFCKPVNIDLLRFGPINHQPNLKALKDSADNSCHFCLLLWETLVQNCNEEYITALLNGHELSIVGSDVGIYLNADFDDFDNPFQDRGIPIDRIHLGIGKKRRINASSYLRVYAHPGRP